MGKSKFRVTKLIADYGPWSLSKILHRDQKNTTRVKKPDYKRARNLGGQGKLRHRKLGKPNGREKNTPASVLCL